MAIEKLDGRAKDEGDDWKSIARTFGKLFFDLVLFLLGLNVYAMTSRTFLIT